MTPGTTVKTPSEVCFEAFGSRIPRAGVGLVFSARIGTFVYLGICSLHLAIFELVVRSWSLSSKPEQAIQFRNSIAGYRILYSIRSGLITPRSTHQVVCDTFLARIRGPAGTATRLPAPATRGSGDHSAWVHWLDFCPVIKAWELEWSLA